MNRPSDIEQLFVYFIHNREEARLNKELGFFPHIEDPILQNYKFCNINREHDRVTRWIDKHIRQQNMSHREMVQTLAVARVFNEPEILQHILPLKSIERLNMKILSLKNSETIKMAFRNAYLMPVHGKNGKGKSAVEYWCDNISKLGKCEPKHTLAEVASDIKQMPAFGPFLVNQICADLRYTEFYKIENTPDWTTYAECGPGTIRGVKRFFEIQPFGPNTSNRIKIDNLMLQKIRDMLKPDCSKEINLHFLDINNLCNSFCEFDKFCRIIDLQIQDSSNVARGKKYKPTKDK